MDAGRRVADVGQACRRRETAEPRDVMEGRCSPGPLEVGDQIRGRRGKVGSGEHEHVVAAAAGHGVGACAAGQQIRAAATDQRVIARSAIERIRAEAAGQAVVAHLAVDQLGSGALGVVDNVRAGRAVGVDGRHGRDGDIHGSRRRGGRAVADEIGEAVRAGVVRIGRVGHHAANQLDHAMAMGRHGDAGHGQDIAVHVRVVGQQGRRGDRHRAVLRDRRDIGVGHRRIVHRRDIDGHRGGSRGCVDAAPGRPTIVLHLEAETGVGAPVGVVSGREREPAGCKVSDRQAQAGRRDPGARRRGDYDGAGGGRKRGDDHGPEVIGRIVGLIGELEV